MEKEADLIITALPDGNLLYEWWCDFCRTYHDDKNCPFSDANDDYYYSLR